jgi:diguanylate cyclase (GGDEF)-like protein/putative nucleotidyltransferase with HDIG domain
MPKLINLLGLSEYGRRVRNLWLTVVLSGTLGALLSGGWLGELSYWQFWQLVCLGAVIVLTGRLAAAMPGTMAVMSPSDPLLFLTVFFLGTPAATLLAGLNGWVVAHRTGCRSEERLYYAASQSLAMAIASWSFYEIINWGGRSPVNNLLGWPISPERLLIAALVMLGIYFVLTSTPVATLQAWRQNAGVGDFWVSHHLWTSIHLFASGTATALVFVLVSNYGPICLLAMAPVMAGAFATGRVYFDKIEATRLYIAQMNRLHLATVEALATAIDAKTQASHAHVRRMQIYAEGLARVLRLQETEVQALRAGALLHDIGKLAVPDQILNKPGKLTPAEFEKMKTHTTVGAQIVERAGFPYPVVPIVCYHHERWDGKGYPVGLKGEQIPITARILSVIDCFTSVREDRPYRRSLTREQACKLLLEERGKQFDPRIVDAFLANLTDFEQEIAAAGLANASGAERAEQESDHGRWQYLNQISSAHREVYSLYEIARSVSSTLELEEAISLFASKLQQLVPFDTCLVCLYDEETAVATVEKVMGKYAEAFNGRRLSPGEGVTGWVLASRQPLFNADPALDLMALKLGAFEFKTMAAMPLLKENLLIGVITLYSETVTHYTEDHLRLLETLSRLAADSLFNVLHHAATRESALTDQLTGLPNSRALYLQFEQEANRANRQNSPFCILMMDLDGFKRINDTYGHQVGDQFLAGISRVIAAEMRSYDFLARYGGDEFVAILPGMTKADVDELTGRIVKAVENYSLPLRGEQNLRVGISIGAARYPTEGASLDRLLRLADQSMYRNKKARQSISVEPAQKGARVIGLHRLRG